MQRDLRLDVMELLEEQVKFMALMEEEAAAMGFSLTEQRPSLCVQIPGGWQIFILKTLTLDDQAEMMAHELGHLLLAGEGLLRVSLDEDWSEGYLAQEMNNVVAHRLMLGRLRKEYGFTTDLHIRLREQVLTQGRELLEEYEGEKTMLQGIGLHLLDLAETTRGNEKQIEELLGMSPIVAQSYEAGREFLLYPVHPMAPEEQWQRMKGFLQRLGYDAAHVRLHG